MISLHFIYNLLPTTNFKRTLKDYLKTFVVFIVSEYMPSEYVASVWISPSLPFIS